MSRGVSKQSEETANLLPTKDTLRALKSDVTLESAILELCDNAIDAWNRFNNHTEETVINIDVNHGKDNSELIISDNAGGLPRSDAAMVFGLGRTAKDQVSGSIGTFGVGAKKALVNLGVPFTVLSRYESEERGWKYRITEDWLEDDQDWSIPITETTDIPPGTTEIRIENLNYNLNEEATAGLRERLGEAYNMFLSDEMQSLTGEEYQLRVLVNGESVKPPGMPDWSYSPFDGLSPRRYENICLESPEFGAPVNLSITVGLLTKKDSQNAGVDIYCQNRKVESCLRDASAGFGTGKHRLGNFNARHERLKVIVELKTEGDGRILPWDTQKSSIDKHNPIMRGTDGCRGVYNWIRRTVRSYYELDADKVPQAFIEPYDRDHDHAVNTGQPSIFDYSDRQRVIKKHRPDTELSDIQEISRKANCHAILLVNCERAIDGWQVDAYRSQLSRDSDRKIENLAKIDSAPPERVAESPHQTAGLITELARIHFEAGIYCSEDLLEWQKPRYDEFMERRDTTELKRLESPPDEIPSSVKDVGDNHQLGNGHGPAVYSEAVLEDPSKKGESAELFLVLGEDSDDERGARILESTREDICRNLDLDNDVADDVLWEEVRSHIESALAK